MIFITNTTISIAFNAEYMWMYLQIYACVYVSIQIYVPLSQQCHNLHCIVTKSFYTVLDASCHVKDFIILLQSKQHEIDVHISKIYLKVCRSEGSRGDVSSPNLFQVK